MKGVDYTNTIKVPRKYKCQKCGAHGVKLWREYMTFQPQLLCAKCAGKISEINIESIDTEGKILSERDGRRTDNIGWFVPAIPDEEGHGYWGYTAVPEAGCKWWYALPSLPVKKKRK